MPRAPLKLLLTGDPGCGKTTVIRTVVQRLRGSVPMRGFVTEEVVEAGRRVGFLGRTLDDETFPLASRKTKGELRVGPYGVALEGLETLGLAALKPRHDTRLIVLDEIGKMELFSRPFRDRVEELLDGEVTLLATIAAHGVGYIKRLRHDSRIDLVRMTRASRAGTVGDLLRRLANAGIGKA